MKEEQHKRCDDARSTIGAPPRRGSPSFDLDIFFRRHLIYGQGALVDGDGSECLHPIYFLVVHMLGSRIWSTLFLRALNILAPNHHAQCHLKPSPLTPTILVGH